MVEILPCYHNRAGHKHMNYTSFIHTLMDNLCSFEDYMNL